MTLIPVYVRKQLDSIYVICKDMTNQREAERKIHRMAHYDALTDLPNRRYAVDHLANVLERQKTGTAVLFLDLNRFKVFNDALATTSVICCWWRQHSVWRIVCLMKASSPG